MIVRLAVALAALADLAIARLLPESGGGLFVRLGAATIVLLVPGGLVADAVGVRFSSATLVWTLTALAGGLGLVFLFTTSFGLALWFMLAVAVAALVFGRGRGRPARVAGTAAVLAVGVGLGALLWHVAVPDVGGDGLFHLARVRKLMELGDLRPSSLDELINGGLHPGYAFPLWHAFLAAIAKLAGVDPALVVQHESALLVPVALAVAYEAGATLFRSAPLGFATLLAQVGVICLAPGHGGAYAVLGLPATASRQLIVPAVLALVFLYVRDRSIPALVSAAAGALVLALVHPTYALFLCIPLAGWLVVRALTVRQDVVPIATALGAVALPAAAVALALLPVVRDTATYTPTAAERLRRIAHYRDQLVVHGDHYHLTPTAFGRGGAIAVAALLMIPLAALAVRKRWAAYVLGGSLAVLATMLLDPLFQQLSDAVSLSQSRRAAGFLPFAFAYAGGSAVLARLLGVFALPLALVGGIVAQRLWPGDFGYRLEHGGPAWATWFAMIGAGVALVFSLLLRGRPALERRDTLAAAAAALFAVPVLVHGFLHWSPTAGPDPFRLTAGAVSFLRDDVPKRDVVFSDLETSYRIAAAAPVLIVAAPTGHVADTKQNRPYARRRDVLRFYRTGTLAIPRRYGSDWLVIARRRLHPRVGLRPAYTDERYLIYKLD